MIAEKPSVAFEVSRILAHGWVDMDKSGPTPVNKFTSQVKGLEGKTILFSSVTGHLFEYRVLEEYDDWKRDPFELFSCPLKRTPILPALHEHIMKLSNGVASIVLWMDNDREGEAICFEVMDIVKKHYEKQKIPIPDNFFKRAIISAISKVDVDNAVKNIGVPNKAISDSSLGRQEVDLRVGFAFTRLLTKSLKYVAPDLFGKVVSFGPCQTPALALCASEEGHTQKVGLKLKDGTKVYVNCSKVDGDELSSYCEGKSPLVSLEPDSKHHKSNRLRFIYKKVKDMSIKPPPALNTVAYLKYASSKYGIPPPEAMDVAEKLYLKGLISYPRTETTAYSTNLDYDKTLEELNSVFHIQSDISYIKSNLKSTIKKVNKRETAVDVGDHMPIIPIVSRPNFSKLVDEINEKEKSLYKMIVDVFFASLSDRAKISRTIAVFKSGENYYKIIEDNPTSEGFTKYFNTITKSAIPIEKMKHAKIRSIGQSEIQESNLIEMMENKGIGTDSTIASHINLLYERGLCEVHDDRAISITPKGECIIQALEHTVPDLAESDLRRKMEQLFLSIEKGKPKDKVVGDCLKYYASVYTNLQSNMELTKSFVKAFVANQKKEATTTTTISSSSSSSKKK